MTVWEPNSSPKRWLKSVGSAEDPMALDWFISAPQELEVIHFARRPAGVRVGDMLVYYAAVHARLLGVVEVFTRPELDATRKKWPHWCRIRPRMMVRDIERAPSINVLNELGGRDFRKTVMQMDKAELTETEYETAAAAIEVAIDLSRGDILRLR